jgi:CelD/BcsL family acetyltransferase involved in cellulose biosynthesis
VKVDLHDRLEAVGAEAWQALHARTRLRSPFLTWTWQSEWARFFAEGRRLEIWLVSDADGPVALLPLYEAEPGTFRILGGTDVSDYLDLIAEADREAEAWAALLAARSTSTAVWDLHAVPAASPTVTALPALAAAAGLAATASVEERCPVLTLPDSWEAYLAALTGKQRHELTRKMRRLEREAPDARPESVAEPAALAARFDTFLDLHRRSHAGKARFMDARMAEFFRTTAVALAGLGMARLFFLEAGGAAIAAFLTLEWDGTVGVYNSGFAPERAALSPGVVLLGHMIRDAIARRRRRFDFLRGEERYKYDFGPDPEDVCAVRIGPR